MPDEGEDFGAKWLAYRLCFLCGFNPVEPADGGANWFMFYNDAKKIVDDLRSRGFDIPTEQPTASDPKDAS